MPNAINQPVGFILCISSLGVRYSLLALIWGLGWIANPAFAVSIEGLLSPGPLSEAHAAFEGNCEACHSPLTETKQQTLCLTCHAEVAKDLSGGTGFHGQHPQVTQAQCQSCHREHKGLDATTLAFDLSNFDHDNTDFPLHWQHAQAGCDSCHKQTQDEPLKYTLAPTECNACHAKDDTHQGSLGTECASCHSSRGWTPALFDHSSTQFPLLGGHAGASCASCHSQGTDKPTPTQCVSCHQQEDAHQGSFGTSCQSCHTPQSWQTSTFRIAQHRSFPLTFGHSGLACNDCHTRGEPTNALQGKSCNSCHTEDDVHRGNNGTQCQSCHTTASWQDNQFQHEAQTGFALMGAHLNLSCGDCHQGALSDPISDSCAGCHSPDPHAGQLGTQCSACHNQSEWQQDLLFSHELTHFPLLGMHSNLECSACHLTSRFHDVDAQCATCHQQDDVHAQAMGGDCGSCHNAATWTVQRFDHGAVSGFTLLGQHQELNCNACHQRPSNMRARGPDECSTCHQQDDPHQNRFGSDCVQCHDNRSFRDIKRL